MLTSTDLLTNDPLHAALAAAGIGLWELHPPTAAMQWSPRARQLLGVAADAAINLPDLWQCLHPDDRATAAAALQGLVAGTGTLDLDCRLAPAPGRPRWVRLTALAPAAADGRPARVAGTLTDITAAKDTALRFQMLAETSPLLVTATDAAGQFQYLNQRVVDYTGLDLDGLQAQWAALVHPDDLPAIGAAWARALQTGQPYEKEYRLRRRDGQYRWLLSYTYPALGPDGRPRAWLNSNLDITDLKQALEAATAREREFLTLANTVAQLAWMAEADGHIFWYNDRWYAYTGTTLEEMQGWGWEKVHHPDHLNDVVTRWQQHLTAGQPWEDTFPLRGQDGAYRWFLSRAYPIRDGQGRVTRWFGTNTDVTEMRRLQQQLESAYQDLEAKVTFRNLELEQQVRALRAQLGP